MHNQTLPSHTIAKPLGEPKNFPEVWYVSSTVPAARTPTSQTGVGLPLRLFTVEDGHGP